MIKPYPQKHFESRFQNSSRYWLPERFMIPAGSIFEQSYGQMTRDEALEKLVNCL